MLKNLERRLKTVERRQKDMDEKLDHIIFRLIRENTSPGRYPDGDDCPREKSGFCGFKGI